VRDIYAMNKKNMSIINPKSRFARFINIGITSFLFKC